LIVNYILPELNHTLLIIVILLQNLLLCVARVFLLLSLVSTSLLVVVMLTLSNKQRSQSCIRVLQENLTRSPHYIQLLYILLHDGPCPMLSNPSKCLCTNHKLNICSMWGWYTIAIHLNTIYFNIFYFIWLYHVLYDIVSCDTLCDWSYASLLSKIK